MPTAIALPRYRTERNPTITPTPEMIRIATSMLQDGHFVRAICGRLGVSVTTWHEWIRRGNDPSETDVMLQAWAEAVEKADAAALEAWTIKVQGLIGNSWPGWFRFAESRWPGEVLRGTAVAQPSISISNTITTVTVNLPPGMPPVQVIDAPAQVRQLPASTHGEDEVE